MRLSQPIAAPGAALSSPRTLGVFVPWWFARPHSPLPGSDSLVTPAPFPTGHLENVPLKVQIAPLATKQSKASKPKFTRSGTEIVGRSAVTGHYVLMPVSKEGAISLARVREAVKFVNSQKKKK